MTPQEIVEDDAAWDVMYGRTPRASCESAGGRSTQDTNTSTKSTASAIPVVPAARVSQDIRNLSQEEFATLKAEKEKRSCQRRQNYNGRGYNVKQHQTRNIPAKLVAVPQQQAKQIVQAQLKPVVQARVKPIVEEKPKPVVEEKMESQLAIEQQAKVPSEKPPKSLVEEQAKLPTREKPNTAEESSKAVAGDKPAPVLEEQSSKLKVDESPKLPGEEPETITGTEPPTTGEAQGVKLAVEEQVQQVAPAAEKEHQPIRNIEEVGELAKEVELPATAEPQSGQNSSNSEGNHTSQVDSRDKSGPVDNLNKGEDTTPDALYPLTYEPVKFENQVPPLQVASSSQARINELDLFQDDGDVMTKVVIKLPTPETEYPNVIIESGSTSPNHKSTGSGTRPTSATSSNWPPLKPPNSKFGYRPADQNRSVIYNAGSGDKFQRKHTFKNYETEEGVEGGRDQIRSWVQFLAYQLLGVRLKLGYCELGDWECSRLGFRIRPVRGFNGGPGPLTPFHGKISSYKLEHVDRRFSWMISYNIWLCENGLLEAVVPNDERYGAEFTCSLEWLSGSGFAPPSITFSPEEVAKRLEAATEEEPVFAPVEPQPDWSHLPPHLRLNASKSATTTDAKKVVTPKKQPYKYPADDEGGPESWPTRIGWLPVPDQVFRPDWAGLPVPEQSPVQPQAPLPVGAPVPVINEPSPEKSIGNSRKYNVSNLKPYIEDILVAASCNFVKHLGVMVMPDEISFGSDIDPSVDYEWMNVDAGTYFWGIDFKGFLCNGTLIDHEGIFTVLRETKEAFDEGSIKPVWKINHDKTVVPENWSGVPLCNRDGNNQVNVLPATMHREIGDSTDQVVRDDEKLISAVETSHGVEEVDGGDKPAEALASTTYEPENSHHDQESSKQPHVLPVQHQKHQLETTPEEPELKDSEITGQDASEVSQIVAVSEVTQQVEVSSDDVTSAEVEDKDSTVEFSIENKAEIVDVEPVIDTPSTNLASGGVEEKVSEVVETNETQENKPEVADVKPTTEQAGSTDQVDEVITITQTVPTKLTEEEDVFTDIAPVVDVIQSSVPSLEIEHKDSIDHGIDSKSETEAKPVDTLKEEVPETMDAEKSEQLETENTQSEPEHIEPTLESSDSTTTDAKPEVDTEEVKAVQEELSTEITQPEESHIDAVIESSDAKSPEMKTSEAASEVLQEPHVDTVAESSDSKLAGSNICDQVEPESFDNHDEVREVSSIKDDSEVQEKKANAPAPAEQVETLNVDDKKSNEIEQKVHKNESLEKISEHMENGANAPIPLPAKGITTAEDVAEKETVKDLTVQNEVSEIEATAEGLALATPPAKLGGTSIHQSSDVVVDSEDTPKEVAQIDAPTHIEDITTVEDVIEKETVQDVVVQAKEPDIEEVVPATTEELEVSTAKSNESVNGDADLGLESKNTSGEANQIDVVTETSDKVSVVATGTETVVEPIIRSPAGEIKAIELTQTEQSDPSTEKEVEDSIPAPVGDPPSSVKPPDIGTEGVQSIIPGETATKGFNHESITAEDNSETVQKDHAEDSISGTVTAENGGSITEIVPYFTVVDEHTVKVHGDKTEELIVPAHGTGQKIFEPLSDDDLENMVKHIPSEYFYLKDLDESDSLDESEDESVVHEPQRSDLVPQKYSRFEHFKDMSEDSSDVEEVEDKAIVPEVQQPEVIGNNTINAAQNIVKDSEEVGGSEQPAGITPDSEISAGSGSIDTLSADPGSSEYSNGAANGETGENADQEDNGSNKPDSDSGSDSGDSSSSSNDEPEEHPSDRSQRPCDNCDRLNEELENLEEDFQRVSNDKENLKHEYNALCSNMNEVYDENEALKVENEQLLVRNQQLEHALLEKEQLALRNQQLEQALLETEQLKQTILAYERATRGLDHRVQTLRAENNRKDQELKQVRSELANEKALSGKYEEVYEELYQQLKLLRPKQFKDAEEAASLEASGKSGGSGDDFSKDNSEDFGKDSRGDSLKDEGKDSGKGSQNQKDKDDREPKEDRNTKHDRGNKDRNTRGDRDGRDRDTKQSRDNKEDHGSKDEEKPQTVMKRDAHGWNVDTPDPRPEIQKKEKEGRDAKKAARQTEQTTQKEVPIHEASDRHRSHSRRERKHRETTTQGEPATHKSHRHSHSSSSNYVPDKKESEKPKERVRFVTQVDGAVREVPETIPQAVSTRESRSDHRSSTSTSTKPPANFRNYGLGPRHLTHSERSAAIREAAKAQKPIGWDPRDSPMLHGEWDDNPVLTPSTPKVSPKNMTADNAAADKPWDNIYPAGDRSRRSARGGPSARPPKGLDHNAHHRFWQAPDDIYKDHPGGTYKGDGYLIDQ